jgi:urease accessory protein
MLEIRERLPSAPSMETVPGELTLTLPFDARQRSRQRVRLDDGSERALLLPRGTMLRDGDQLRDEKGQIIRLRAADESVSTVHAQDPLLLARICYHLGNRHVPLQIGAGWLRYRHDHVLDGMVAALGLPALHEQAPFEPESGAYFGGGHAHSPHVHDHDMATGSGTVGDVP